MVQGVPLEHNFIAGNVDLIDYGIDGPACTRSSNGRQVVLSDVVCRDENRPLGGYVNLMQIDIAREVLRCVEGQEIAGKSAGRNLCVSGVEDHNRAIATADWLRKDASIPVS